jgi:hypothetical protein
MKFTSEGLLLMQRPSWEVDSRSPIQEIPSLYRHWNLRSEFLLVRSHCNRLLRLPHCSPSTTISCMLSCKCSTGVITHHCFPSDVPTASNINSKQNHKVLWSLSQILFGVTSLPLRYAP